MKPSLIEHDTALMPWIIADSVCLEVASFTTRQTASRYSSALARRAQRIYNCNTIFRKRLRSVGGREYLYAFMKHWLASIMKRKHRAQWEKLPHGYGWSV